jgi:hypothetical protein
MMPPPLHYEVRSIALDVARTQLVPVLEVQGDEASLGRIASSPHVRHVISDLTGDNYVWLAVDLPGHGPCAECGAKTGHNLGPPRIAICLPPVAAPISDATIEAIKRQIDRLCVLLDAAISQDDPRLQEQAVRAAGRCTPRSRPEPFALDLLAVPSDPHTQAVVRSFWASPSEWQHAADATVYYNDSESLQVVVRPNALMSAAQAVPTSTTAHQVLAQDDRRVSTFLIVLAKWYQDTGGQTQPIAPAHIHVEDVLSCRGVQKHHRGGYRRQQKDEVRQDILLLRDIWVRSDQDAWGQQGTGKRRPVRVHVDSPLLEVEIESTTDGVSGEDVPYGFRIQPGSWITVYLNDHTRWVAHVLRRAMQYHPVRDRVAMRLAIYLAFQWRIRARHGKFDQAWQMATLLNSAKIPMPVRNRDRFRQEVERALYRLHQDGLLGAAPECLDPVPENVAPKDWWRLWLAGRWRLRPPPEIVDANPRPALRPGRGRRARRAAG